MRAAPRRHRLGVPEQRSVEQDLPLQVGQFDPVAVEQAERADAGGRQVQRGRRAEAPGTDHQHARRLQALLAGSADLTEGEVAR